MNIQERYQESDYTTHVASKSGKYYETIRSNKTKYEAIADHLNSI